MAIQCVIHTRAVHPPRETFVYVYYIVEAVQAGMVTKLAARTSVLAAMNPVGQYDPMRTLEANTGLPPPLLSRFDVVLVLVDGVNESRCASAATPQGLGCRLSQSCRVDADVAVAAVFSTDSWRQAACACSAPTALSCCTAVMDEELRECAAVPCVALWMADPAIDD